MTEVSMYHDGSRRLRTDSDMQCEANADHILHPGATRQRHPGFVRDRVDRILDVVQMKHPRQLAPIA